MTSSKSKPKVPTFKYHYTGGYDFNIWILESHKYSFYNTWVRIPAIYYAALANYYSLSNSVSSAVKMGLHPSLPWSVESFETPIWEMEDLHIFHFPSDLNPAPCWPSTPILLPTSLTHAHHFLSLGLCIKVCEWGKYNVCANVPQSKPSGMYLQLNKVGREQSWTY